MASPNPAPTHRGLFLDLDGTLAHSHGMLATCYGRLLRVLEAPADAPSFEAMSAFTLPDIVTQLSAGREDLDRRVLLEDYERWVIEGYAEVPPHDGALTLLRWAREVGYRTAVVTSAAEEPSTRWLDAHGLMDHIEFVIGRGSVTRTKPDPAPYQLALERTRCTPAESAAIEDSPSGATSAIGAGLPTYVLGPEPRDRSAWPAVTAFLPSLLDVREYLA